MQHIIQRQLIEISSADIQTAKLLQQGMDAVFKTQVINVMDQVLTDFSDAQSVIRLDKLELDLGTMTLDQLDSQFMTNLKEQLSLVLQKEIAQIESEIQHKMAVTHEHSQHQSDLDLLMYFLQQGSLPWWAGNTPSGEIERLLLNKLHQQPVGLLQRLRHTNSILVFERLVMQFSSQAYHALLKQLMTANNKEEVNAIKDWLSISESRYLQARVAMQMQAHIAYFLVHTPTNITLQLLSEYLYQAVLIKQNSEAEKNNFKLLATNIASLNLESNTTLGWIEEKIKLLFPEAKNSKIVLGLKPSTDTPSKIQREKQARIEKMASEPSSPALLNAADPLVKSLTKKTAADLSESRLATQSLIQQSALTEPALSLEQYQYIDNAGIVLLWPFLQRYFSTLNLVEDKQFVSVDAQEKAVLLLHYLATGNKQSEEFNLLLCKLLCGWAIEQPLQNELELNEREKQESEQLILAVIEHWKALKKTSVDGLRHSFLQREGRLEEKEYAWNILINRTGFDVLLNQLPWGVSTIHLPWMQKTVFVEW